MTTLYPGGGGIEPHDPDWPWEGFGGIEIVEWLHPVKWSMEGGQFIGVLILYIILAIGISAIVSWHVAPVKDENERRL